MFLALLALVTKYGKRSGYAFSFGVVASDLMYAFLVYYGFLLIGKGIPDRISNLMLGIGGALFVGLGVYLLFNAKSEKLTSELESEKKKILSYFKDTAIFFQAFLLNSFNPSVMVFWIVIIAQLIQSWQTEAPQGWFFVFIASVLVVFFL